MLPIVIYVMMIRFFCIFFGLDYYIYWLTLSMPVGVFCRGLGIIYIIVGMFLYS